MQFSDIIGQEEVKQHLVQTVLENRVSHAQLFAGPEGCGSMALALSSWTDLISFSIISF